MPSFAGDLQRALGAILGFEVPPPEGDTMRFYGQWLAERNLGLVPIADPSGFAWAGHWIARTGDRAVLMFGSPSGPLDPEQALDTRSIEEGWLVARLDVHLPIDEPYGAARQAGTVEAVMIAPEAEAPLVRVASAAAIAGRGLDGDRYGRGRGTFSAPGRGYELTLVETEVLDELRLPWEEARRNIATRGADLNALVGRRFLVGEAECIGRRLAEPCAHLERVSRPGLLRPLVHRAGLRADILSDGTISVGDRVEPID